LGSRRRCRPTALSSCYAYCQTGLGTLTPHLHPTGREIQQGDLIALNVFPVVDGYCMELERTFVLGEPTRQAQHALDTVTTVFEATKQTVRSGASMADIDRLAQAALDEAGYGKSIRHGTGHAHGIMIGSAGREELGELRHYNNRNLAPNMVCSVEPGIYISDLGGFRHSDVMLVAPAHTECLTEFPVGQEITEGRRPQIPSKPRT
jgi:Xaa-Pro aminopeptidase